jgi:hypothetical protein
MKKSSKVLLALATIWPLIYMVFFIGVIFLNLFMGDNQGFIWAIIIPLHLLTMLWIIALTIWYMVNVFRNDRVNKDMKVLWAVVLFMGNVIAMPIYWYLYIWQDSPSVSVAVDPS